MRDDEFVLTPSHVIAKMPVERGSSRSNKPWAECVSRIGVVIKTTAILSPSLIWLGLYPEAEMPESQQVVKPACERPSRLRWWRWTRCTTTGSVHLIRPASCMRCGGMLFTDEKISPNGDLDSWSTKKQSISLQHGPADIDLAGNVKLVRQAPTPVGALGPMKEIRWQVTFTNLLFRKRTVRKSCV